MGTQVLRPQDCLIQRIRTPPSAFYRRRSHGSPVYSYYNNSYNSYASFTSRSTRKPATRTERKKVVGSTQLEPSFWKRSRSRSTDDLKDAKGSGLAMEKVTILRRGESLDSKIKSEALKKEGDDVIACGTQRLGPDPQRVPKQVRIVDMKLGLAPVAMKSDIYAGSAFAASPSPSALPLPSFSKKQSLAVVDDSASRDLRRLLRLE